DELLLDVAQTVAPAYPELEYEEKAVNDVGRQLMQEPELYDVLVLPGLSGDELFDLCTGIIGEPCLAPAAIFGEDIAVFEAARSNAPEHAGMNRVNPIATILSGVLMLRYVREKDAADRLENAIAGVIAEGRTVTYDLKADRNDPTAVGTSQVAD